MHAQVLLPSPYSVEPGDGSYSLSSKTVSVYIGDGVDAPREFLQTDVFEGRRVRFVAHQDRADVVLTHAADCLPEAMLDQRLFLRILALAEQMWHAGTLQPFDVFYQRAYEMKPWFESHGYSFGPALKETQGETAK